MNKRYIHITKADRDFIAKALNVTEKTVYNAIRFDDRRGNSELSAKIRKLAHGSWRYCDGCYSGNRNFP